MDLINLIVNFLPSLRIFFYFKIIFIVLALVLLFLTILFLLKSSWLKHRFLESWTEFFIYRPFGAKKAFKQWSKIEKRIEGGNEADCKMAIIEADTLLSEVFREMGYSGETIEENLKQLDSATLPNIEEVLLAHQTRDNVVHDPDYKLTLEKTKKTLSIYQQALRDLEMF